MQARWACVCVCALSLIAAHAGFQHAWKSIPPWWHFAQQFQVPGVLGKAKPIWIINIDSGLDEHPAHYASIIANAILFVQCNLQLLMLLSLAAGFSSMNEHKQSQGAVTNVTSGAVYPLDQYGTVKQNQYGQPVTDADPELEKRNHAYAVETSRKMLDGKNSACAWGRTMHAFTGSKSESIDDEAILKYHDGIAAARETATQTDVASAMLKMCHVPSDVLARGSARTHHQHQNCRAGVTAAE